MLSRRYKLLRISLIMINLLHCFSFLSNSATSSKYISASSIITASASIHIIESSKESNDSSVPMNRPSKPVNTINTALLQYGRLVGTHNEHEVMSRTERLIRIIISWTLLLFAKSISLASPLFFKKLIEAGSLADESLKTSGSITSMIQTSALGLIIGYGSFKIAAGFVQLLSELILNPVTTFVAEILPKEAFSAALWRASKRINEGKQKETSAFESKRVKAIIARVNNLTPSRAKNISAKEVVASSSSSSSSTNEIKGQITQACRSLDRGMKASNQFLYRSVFNLLPSFVESLCALILIFRSTSVIVGTTAIVVAFTFVAVTATIMHYRVNIMRAQIVEESKANGFAEDALLLAETVAAFGAMQIEESRYADALRSVSHTSLYMRRSFSFLKVMQAVVMGLGSGALIFAAWWSHHPDCWVGLGLTDGFTEEVRTITGTLILTQALFAQLCAPLDHVGQHFRDCVQAAEDMRELEVLKRDCNDLMVEQSTPKNIVQEQPNDLPINPSDNAITDSYTLVSNTRFSHVITDDKLKQNKYNTFPILSQFPIVSDCKLSLDNLFFAYPTIGSDSSSYKHSYTLKNVSFSMPFGGYSIGIVGPSGSGKSTLVRVLLGLESIDNPKSMSSGRVIIDGRDLSPFNRVPFFSMVGQDSDLFRGLTLVDNVRYGSETLFGAEKFTAEQKDLALHRAALDAQLYPVISKLENGWKANVGPRGRLLSGGERQRTCLARALYRQELGGGMLLMDEVTASLDAQTESIVTNAIMSRVQQGASAILIAHRLSSVVQCNLILVLKDGEIIEHGTHQQLIEKVDGWYAESWVLQSQSQQSSSAVAYWE